jgi:tetratricopeptide (TPR) repeat protein
VWSQDFERRQIDNPLELQTEIARGSVSAIENRIALATTGAGLVAPLALKFRKWFNLQTAAGLPGPPTYSNAAFDDYMRGRNLLEELEASSTRAALNYFRRAVEEDPGFALAYAALADAHLSLMNYETAPSAELSAAARTYAEEAVNRDPGLAEAHMVLGAVRQNNWEWAASESSYREALRLKPMLARARRWYAGLILQFRRFDEAIAETKRAIDQDPYDRTTATTLGLFLFVAGRFQQSADVLESAIAVRDMSLTRWNLGLTYAWMGHLASGPAAAGWFAKAFQQAQAAVALERSAPGPATPSATEAGVLALLHTLAGDPGAAEPHLQQAEAAMNSGTLSPVIVSRIYAARGDRTRAIQLLKRAALSRDRRLLYVNISPLMESLHGEPEFGDLLKQMNLS